MSPRTALTTAAASATLLLALTGCSSGSGQSSDAAAPPAGGTGTTETTAPEAPAAPEAPGFGTPVTVGTFEFTASALADIGTTVGTPPLSQDAQGTYLQLDLSVKNVGDSAEMFLSNYVKLIDADGRTFDSDSTASIYADGASVWVSTINPGNAMSGPIFFDVPAGTQPVAIQVTDNMFADGEKITVK